MTDTVSEDQDRETHRHKASTCDSGRGHRALVASCSFATSTQDNLGFSNTSDGWPRVMVS